MLLKSGNKDILLQDKFMVVVPFDKTRAFVNILLPHESSFYIGKLVFSLFFTTSRAKSRYKSVAVTIKERSLNKL